MHDYALVLNAGSSSLKFCVFVRPTGDAWRVASRGQIEGIGTSPRISARNSEREVLVDQDLATAVRDQRSALDALAQWLRSRYAGARVLGVGHRVVHGGRRYAAPTVLTPEVLADLRALEPLAPLHQPHNLAAIEAVFERLPDVPQVACFDTSFHRTQLSFGAIDRATKSRFVTQVCSDMGFTGSHTSTSPLCCLRSRRKSLKDGSSLRIWEAAPVFALSKTARVWIAASGSRPWTDLCMGTRPGSIRPGRDAVPVRQPKTNFI